MRGLRRPPSKWSNDELDRQLVAAYRGRYDATTGYAKVWRHRVAVVYHQDASLLPKRMLRRTARDLGPDFFTPYLTYLFEWFEIQATGEEPWWEQPKEGWDSFDSEEAARAAGREWVGPVGKDVPLAAVWERHPRVRQLIRQRA